MSLPIIADDQVFDPSLFCADTAAYCVIPTERGNVVPLGVFADVQLWLLKQFGTNETRVPLLGSNTIRLSLAQAQLTVQVGMDHNHAGFHLVFRNDHDDGRGGESRGKVQLSSAAVRAVVEAVVVGVVGQVKYNEFLYLQRRQTSSESPSLADLLGHALLRVSPACAVCVRPVPEASCSLSPATPRTHQPRSVFDTLDSKAESQPVCPVHEGTPTLQSLVLPWLEATDRAAHDYDEWLRKLPPGTDSATDVPECAIRRAIPRDPVHFCNDSTASLFERSAIELHLRRERRHPLTGLPASVDDLIADSDAKARVDAVVARLRDEAARAEADANRVAKEEAAAKQASAASIQSAHLRPELPPLSLVDRACQVGRIITGAGSETPRQRARKAMDSQVRPVMAQVVVVSAHLRSEGRYIAGLADPATIEASDSTKIMFSPMNVGVLAADGSDRATRLADDLVHLKRLIAYVCLGQPELSNWETCCNAALDALASDLRAVFMYEAADLMSAAVVDHSALRDHRLFKSPSSGNTADNTRCIRADAGVKYLCHAVAPIMDRLVHLAHARLVQQARNALDADLQAGRDHIYKTRGLLARVIPDGLTIKSSDVDADKLDTTDLSGPDKGALRHGLKHLPAKEAAVREIEPALAWLDTSLNRVVEEGAESVGAGCPLCASSVAAPKPGPEPKVGKRTAAQEAGSKKKPAGFEAEACRACKALRDVIFASHTGKGPTWINATASLWATTPWEVAKVFMSSIGDANVRSARTCDVNQFNMLSFWSTIGDVAVSDAADNPRGLGWTPDDDWATFTAAFATSLRGIRNSVSHHPTGELSEAAFAEIVSKLEPIARHPKIDADGLCSQNLEDVLAGYRAELALKIPI
jgi:hypothetical protein